jgi:hypothetical protein
VPSALPVFGWPALVAKRLGLAMSAMPPHAGVSALSFSYCALELQTELYFSPASALKIHFFV